MNYKELSPTFAILNYLAAALQGRFAGLNILGQLNSPLADAAVVTEVRDALTQTSAWSRAMWNGDLLFSENAEPSFEAQRALDLLRAQKPDLIQLIKQLRATLGTPLVDNPDAPIALQLLVASLGRAAYARENYIRGFLEFGKVTERADIVENYTQLLTTATSDIKFAHQMLETLREAESLDRGFLDQLFFRSRDLPFTFGSHFHDINQLLASTSGGLNFENADFGPEEITAWTMSGLSPFFAGYWRAYGFSAEQAQPWYAANITDAAFASEWRWYGFDFAHAAPWITIGLLPQQSWRWAQAGFSAEEAAEYIRDGATDPGQVTR